MYRVILSLHVVCVISWMAGILYLIRLFVYHRAETESVVKERFQVMERKLFRIITLPASTASLFFGAWMLFLDPSLFGRHWMQIKLVLVFILLGLTHACGGYIRKFAANENPKTETFFRIYNEIPTLLMIGIVFLAILKPF